jgi:hypothetical protein
MENDINAVFTRWKECMGHTRARLDIVRRKAIGAMLRCGYSVDDLHLAIFGCSISDFHQGNNDRQMKYDDITLICRDAQHVDKFIQIAERHAAKAARRAQERAGESRPTAPSAIPEHLRKFVKPAA